MSPELTDGFRQDLQNQPCRKEPLRTLRSVTACGVKTDNNLARRLLGLTELGRDHKYLVKKRQSGV